MIALTKRFVKKKIYEQKKMSQSRIICQGKDKLKIWNVDFQGNGKQNKVLHVSLQVSLFDVKIINCSDSGTIFVHFNKKVLHNPLRIPGKGKTKDSIA